MKKILLFLFALFSFYPIVNASEYVMTELSFNAHAQNKTNSQGINGISKIYNQVYELRNSKGELVDNISHTGYHGGLKYDEYDLIETKPALGFYQNKQFKYHFTISRECPRIKFDITKNVINEDIQIHFKDNLVHKMWIQDSNYKTIYNERKLTNDVNINLIYDIYQINVDGKIIYTFDMTNPSYHENNNLFSNDSLSINILPNSYYDGYEPVTTIITSCFNENDELISNTQKYVWKDEETSYEEDISISKSVDIHNEELLIVETNNNVEIIDTNFEKEINNEIINGTSIDKLPNLAFEETFEEPINFDINQTKDSVSEVPIIRYQKKKKELNYTPILSKLDNIEEKEDNLIIEKLNNNSFYPKVVQKNSLWPFLIITLLLSISIKIMYKIIKKVQK